MIMQIFSVDDYSDADDEEELVGFFEEEDNEEFWFTDGKSNSALSPTSTFDFIDSSDLCDDSGDLSDGYNSMPDLGDVTDSSNNEENNIPSLKSFSETFEDEDYMVIIRSQKHLKNQQTSRRHMI